MNKIEIQGAGDSPSMTKKLQNSNTEFVVSFTKTFPDYSVYLRTEAATAEVHGIFVVTPDPHSKDAIHTTQKVQYHRTAGPRQRVQIHHEEREKRMQVFNTCRMKRRLSALTA